MVAVGYLAQRLTWAHQHRGWLYLAAVGPCALLVVTRVWQWRSHQVHVTSRRVVVEAGAVRHQASSLELRDVLATRVEQSFGERLARRGHLYVETVGGSVFLGRVRHPGALARVIDRERARLGYEMSRSTDFHFESVAPPGFYDPPSAPPTRSGWSMSQYRE